jgi:YjjG family noncanonical pyrimidine nucleotidase
MKYEWLLLDADGTLFDYDRAEAMALDRTFRELGHDYRPAYATAYRRINGAIWREFEQGRITQARLRTRRFELLFQEAGFESDAERFSQQYLENLAMGTELMPGAQEVLSTLHGRIGLALITNGLQDVQRPRLARSTIGHYLDPVIISEEVGFSKPDARIFQAAFEATGHPRKEDVLMVGDSLTSDIRGGNNFGIDTCWFNPGREVYPPELSVCYEIQNLCQLLDLLEEETDGSFRTRAPNSGRLS